MPVTPFHFGVGRHCGLTHPVLDGIMHDSTRPFLPFLPFTSANPLHLAMGLGPLHLPCILSGVVGVRPRY